jgi:ribosomal protein S18 acetylase RimI-like enzyme
MIFIRPLNELNDDLLALIQGYTTHSIYVVEKLAQEELTSITLRLTPLDLPLTKRFDPPDEYLAGHYQEVVKKGLSFAAYDQARPVAIALADAQQWNRSLWVWEFHVEPSYQGEGIGRQLMHTLAESGKAAGLRVIVCETQSTNVPAIKFYRSVGFTVEGIDLSYYTNEDMEPGREVAVFMKRRLE